MHNNIKYIAVVILVFISELSYADDYYKNYFQRATKLIIPMANAQEAPAEELQKPSQDKKYIVPALKTDSVNMAKNNSVIAEPTNKHHLIVHKANIPLNAKAKKGLMLAEKYINDDDYARPSADGVVKFQYGKGQPTLICAPLQVCGIMLEKDEILTGHNLGDKTSWDFITTQMNNNVIVVKPNTPNISTNVLIFTLKNGTRRQYSIRLIAHPTRYMPFIAFNYPDDLDAQNAKYYADVKVKLDKQEKQQIVSNAKYALSTSNVDSKYEISGNAQFKIDQVITDGIKTYIYLKDFSQGDELPFFIGETADKKELMANQAYDAEKNRFIVDYKVKVGYLQAGEDKLKITYRGKK